MNKVAGSLPERASPLVSVIVPCYNSARNIRRCLDAILSQQTSASFDVTVVDSSLDETARIVGDEYPSVRLVRLNERTYAGAARNIGVRSSSGDYCLMIDSDCIAEPDVIDRMIARHHEADYAAVGGSLANGTPQSVSGWICYLMEFKDFMPTSPMRLEKSVPTANVAYRRGTFDQFGYFDDDMWLAEDILFNWKVVTAGRQILFDPSIRVIHLNRTGWLEVLTYQVSLGRLSAEARRRGGLPGQSLLRCPFLILLLPFARLYRAFRWLGENDRRAFLIFALIWPMYLVAATCWSYGFLQGVLDGGSRRAC